MIHRKNKKFVMGALMLTLAFAMQLVSPVFIQAKKNRKEGKNRKEDRKEKVQLSE